MDQCGQAFSSVFVGGMTIGLNKQFLQRLSVNNKWKTWLQLQPLLSDLITGAGNICFVNCRCTTWYPDLILKQFFIDDSFTLSVTYKLMTELVFNAEQVQSLVYALLSCAVCQYISKHIYLKATQALSFFSTSGRIRTDDGISTVTLNGLHRFPHVTCSSGMWNVECGMAIRCHQQYFI